ncbi:MAG TPA: fumarylacetoacetate hydrolase family protein [Gemmatimonadaceae bacterium]|nr:fumarylacetoacetate hydrolase family protein [Gemmatimonadaceae bacterium]
MSSFKIVCVGRNYRKHAEELGNQVPASPILFLKPPSSLVEPGQPIELPPVSNQVDYEGEIGVIIGTRLKDAGPDEARAAVRGIVAANDVTARDVQKSDGQWTRGKGFDTFCPVGPMGEAPDDLSTLQVVTRVNGAERQRGRASDMLFDIPALLSFISGVMTLEPGDLVLTGTPEGVGKLAAGDEVEVEVVGPSTGVSRVTNPVREKT